MPPSCNPAVNLIPCNECGTAIPTPFLLRETASVDTTSDMELELHEFVYLPINVGNRLLLSAGADFTVEYSVYVHRLSKVGLGAAL